MARGGWVVLFLRFFSFVISCRRFFFCLELQKYRMAEDCIMQIDLDTVVQDISLDEHLVNLSSKLWIRLIV
jgi:hypothetical protein